MQLSVEQDPEQGAGTYRGEKCHSKFRDSTSSLIKTQSFFQLKFILDHHWYSDTQRHTHFAKYGVERNTNNTKKKITPARFSFLIEYLFYCQE